MADAPDFAKLVPGFEFLQNLAKNANAVLPGIGQWVAPTLDPEELDKRIQELKTVQFWLEQNARMLATTIQALEVQKMTLSALKTMNVQVADLQEAMRIKTPQPAPPEAADDATDAADDAPEPAPAPTATPGLVDPMQWWGALTRQFTDIASHAMKDAAAHPAQQLAGDLVRQGVSAAGETFKAGLAPVQQGAQTAGAAWPAVFAPTSRAVGPRAAAKTASKAPSSKAAARKSTAKTAGAARKRPAGGR